jgi:chromosome partitioning protein
MRSLAVINQKGGAGKTTTAVNVADALARAGERVLLIDLDPQSHATLHLGVQLGAEEPSVYDVLVRDVPVREAWRSAAERLTLLPAGIDLVGAEIELRERPEREYALARALESCDGDFSYCIVDCPPSLGELTINALAAVDELIIPLQPHFLALQGMGRLLETVTLVRGVLNPRLRVSGIALCMFETGTRLAQEVLTDITEFIAAAAPDDAWFGARVFDTKVRRNIKLAECPSFGQTIHAYAPGSHGAIDYQALTEEIVRAHAAATVDRPDATEPVSKPVADVLPTGTAVPEPVGPNAALILPHSADRPEP